MWGGTTWAGQFFAGATWAPKKVPPPFTYNTVTTDPDFAYKPCFPDGGILGPPINPTAWLPDEFGGDHVVVGFGDGVVVTDPDYGFPIGDLQLYNPTAFLPDEFDSDHTVVTPISR